MGIYYWQADLFLPLQSISEDLFNRCRSILQDEGWLPGNHRRNPPEETVRYYVFEEGPHEGFQDGTWEEAVQASLVQKRSSIEFVSTEPYDTYYPLHAWLKISETVKMPLSLDPIEECNQLLPFTLILVQVEMKHSDSKFFLAYNLSRRFFAEFEPLYAYGDMDDASYGRHLGTHKNRKYSWGPSYKEIMGEQLPPLFWLNYFTPAHMKLLPLDQILSCPIADIVTYSNGSASVFLGPTLLSDGKVDYQAAAKVAEHLGLRSWHLTMDHPLDLPEDFVIL